MKISRRYLILEGREYILLFVALLSNACNSTIIIGSTSDIIDDNDSGDALNEYDSIDELSDSALDITVDSGADTPAHTDTCGNGVLDSFEECDDGNRMNDDGCDWLCNIGNGDEPDRTPNNTVIDLIPIGDSVPITIDDDIVRGGENTIDLKWNGDQLSVLYYAESTTVSTYRSVFRRFNILGAELDNLWEEDTGTFNGNITVDHAWNGSEYGITYANNSIDGIWFVRINEAGKRLNDPVHMVDDQNALHQSIVWTGSNYGVAWHQEPTDFMSDCYVDGSNSYFNIFSPLGEPIMEEAVQLESNTAFESHIVFGEDGIFRIVTTIRRLATDFIYPFPSDACLYVVKTHALSAYGEILHSMEIGVGKSANIAWRNNEYAITFIVPDFYAFSPRNVFMARMNGISNLLEAPYRIHNMDEAIDHTVLVPDTYGYCLLWDYLDIYIARLDDRGRLVGSYNISEYPHTALNDMVTADNNVAVIYVDELGGMYLQLFGL